MNKKQKEIIKEAMTDKEELFNGKQDTLAMAAGCLGRLTNEALDEQTTAIIYEVVKAHQENDSFEGFEKTINKTLNLNKKIVRFRRIMLFLSEYSVKVAKLVDSAKNEDNESLQIESPATNRN